MTKKATKPEDTTTKPIKAEQEVVTKASPGKGKKPTTDAKVSTPKLTQSKVAAKPVAAKMDISMSESIGAAAGSIWQYLDSNGATTIAKLVKELSEDEKSIQRGIGWLMREDKITLTAINRVETVVLKG